MRNFILFTALLCFSMSFFGQEKKEAKNSYICAQSEKERIYDFSLCSSSNYKKCFKDIETPNVFNLSKAKEEKKAKSIYRKQLSKYIFNHLDNNSFSFFEKKVNKKDSTFTLRLIYWTDKKGKVIKDLINSNVRKENFELHKKLVFLLTQTKLNKKDSPFISEYLNNQLSISIRLKKDPESNSFVLIKKKKKKKKWKFNPNDSITSPIYKGCHLLDDKYAEETLKAEKKCMEHHITNLILNNIDKTVIRNCTSKLTRYSIYDKKIRSFFQFTFTKEGSIENLKTLSLFPEFEKEVISVLQDIPKVQPGTKKGEPVNVKYSLPIIFSTPKK